MTVHVVGNAALDLTFRVRRFPAPGETLIAEGRSSAELGGKGANQAVVARRFGVDVRLTAALGRDEPATFLRERLAAAGLDGPSILAVDAETDESIITVTPDGENTVVSSATAAQCLMPADARAALDTAAAGDILLVQGNLRRDTTYAALERARALGMATLLNPAPVQWDAAEMWSLCDIAILNRVEADAFARAATPEAACRVLRAAGVGAAVVTLGGQGLCWSGPTGDGKMPAEPVRAIDTAGAGDALCGALAAGIARGETLAAALVTASRCAAITVSRPGTQMAFPSTAEAERIIARGAA